MYFTSACYLTFSSYKILSFRDEKIVYVKKIEVWEIVEEIQVLRV